MGIKSRSNYNIGKCLPTCQCRSCQMKRLKRFKKATTYTPIENKMPGGGYLVFSPSLKKKLIQEIKQMKQYKWPVKSTNKEKKK